MERDSDRLSSPRDACVAGGYALIHGVRAVVRYGIAFHSHELVRMVVRRL